MLIDYFSRPPSVTYPTDGAPVERTAAETFVRQIGAGAPRSAERPGAGVRVGLADGAWVLQPDALPDDARAWLWVRLTPDGEGELAASEPALLYALTHFLHTDLTDDQRARLSDGLLLRAAFPWHRPLYDNVLTQTARSIRDFDPEVYIETLARTGFTHVEVNALATHLPFEPGVPNEYYNQFYTYCAGLNQFVDTPLTRGIYPHEYLAANLNKLKRLAAVGRKYGLKPGLLCFEPRTLPEHFFRRYPTLRGARVDHPFRSHVPRYTLAQDHPATKRHYRELVQNLMREVPDLDYLSVWTNDSGAGFEHTASLYVGRNGGPYMIREWRSHEKIAQAAGASAAAWLRLLRDAAAEVNPDFQVILRIEPFKVEHDAILDGMGDGVTFEAPSLLVRGYHLPYHHPKYPEQESIAGSLHHVSMDDEERERLAAYRARDIEPKVTYSASAAFNMEPLLGIPFPRQLHQKMSALRDLGLDAVSAFGGLLHVEKTPYWPNPEVIRLFQLDPERPADTVLHAAAARWAGSDAADTLVELWDDVDEAVAHLPIVMLYSFFGFTWLRTWVRPFIPNLEAPSKEERLYYERFLVSTPNNPSINDLGRDVLFELISEESGRRMAGHFDREALPRIDAALDRIDAALEKADDLARAVFTDLRDRVRALRCWTETQRNTCAWVAGVYGYLGAETDDDRANHYAVIYDLMERERANAVALLDLWESSDTEFMMVSDIGETSSIYGENFGDLVRRKIDLMDRYADVEPFIDRDILWRLA